MLQSTGPWFILLTDNRPFLLTFALLYKGRGKILCDKLRISRKWSFHLKFIKQAFSEIDKFHTKWPRAWDFFYHMYNFAWISFMDICQHPLQKTQYCFWMSFRRTPSITSHYFGSESSTVASLSKKMASNKRHFPMYDITGHP